LVDAAAEQGLTLEIAKVRSQPFTLRVTLEGVELRGPQIGRLAVEQASADLSWASLWGRGAYEAAARLDGGAGEIVSRGTLSLRPLALHEVVIKGNEFAAQGSVALQPLRADLEVELDALPLAAAQRWLPETVGVKIASGALSGKGALRIQEASVAYEGAAAVRGLRLEERDSGTLLLAWQLAETDALKIALAPLRLEIGEMVAREPEGRLVIAQDGSVNLADAVPKGRGQGEPARIALERLRIEKGTLHFADRSLANPFELTIRELSGTLTDLGNVSAEPAHIRLAGRVQPYGSARIRGTIDLDAPTQLADVRADLRNLQLEAFNPYITKFAGYRIASGRLSAQLRYELRDRRMVGTNKLVFERIQLGEKLETKGLLDLPLELAVALLADAQGRIELDIPVRGNLNDPKFDLGAIVARAFGNVVRKVVSAPFRALAGLFGGKDRDLGAVPFDPGSAVLTPPAEEDIAQVAKALAQRPRLAIQVHGGYDPARDPEALRLRAARAELARAAGVEGAPDLSDPKVLRAAERLFLKRGGERAELAALRKSEPRYGRALLQRLAAAVPADAAAIQALAQARAEAVRAALLDHGVEPARVRVAEEAVEKRAEEEGVPTQLSVMATSPAQPVAFRP
ncbi:MAG TPA: DUF748 domain-containing protein, partial [Burkholderiales bacterium]|nr:DUF748 domain-containing protein [Burkholderiales bacterium]